MGIRVHLAALLLFAWPCLVPRVLAPSSEPIHPSISALADRYVAIRLAADPTVADRSGLKGRQDELPNLSPASLRHFNDEEDTLWSELSKISPETISADDRPTYAVLKEALTANRGLRVCKTELWDLSHYWGWQTQFSRIAASQPVDTPEEREAALRRWASLPTYLHQDVENLKTGLAQGYSAPKSVVKRVIRQIDGLIVADPAKSPFASPALRSKDADFNAAFIKIVTDQIDPALKEYRAFLITEYLPRAREALAVSALPQGRACYEAALRKFTTLSRSPEEVFSLGEAIVAKNQTETITIGRRLYGTDDYTTIIARNKEAPGNHFASADDLLAFSRQTLSRAIEKSRPLFFHLPDQPVVIEPLPAFEEGSGVDAHYNPQPDPSKPGKYILPLDTWRSETRGDAEITVFHETIPGHHLQRALARQMQHTGDIFKLSFNSAYIEGWARYAERLSEEAGLYTTDYAKIERRVWPAHGMVIDPGIHVFGWSNQKAIDYLKATGQFDDRTASDLLDRIAVMPGQLTAYDTGGSEIFALRKEAEDALGPRFDLREFNQQVLEEGVVPLEELQAHVGTWIKEKAKNSK